MSNVRIEVLKSEVLKSHVVRVDYKTDEVSVDSNGNFCIPLELDKPNKVSEILYCGWENFDFTSSPAPDGQGTHDINALNWVVFYKDRNTRDYKHIYVGPTAVKEAKAAGQNELHPVLAVEIPSERRGVLHIQAINSVRVRQNVTAEGEEVDCRLFGMATIPFDTRVNR